MSFPRRQPADLDGKVIDMHSHVGVLFRSYANREYPYAETVEGLYYRQCAAGVDVNVVFPFAPELYFDIPVWLRTGNAVPADDPFSPAPYIVENEQLLMEVYRFCPEYEGRFLPFVMADPMHEVPAQVAAVAALADEYPVYGIKISPVFCQASISGLLGPGRPLVDLALDRDWPLLVHSTADPQETYSQVTDILRVAEAYPGLRVCIAHCAAFDREGLERADALPNVWVDSAAMKIQVELAAANNPIMAPPERRFPADYSDHCSVMRSLVKSFPRTMLWGSDSPAYAYICRRKQADGLIREFRAKANYEDEKAALDALPAAQRMAVCNHNVLRFLFG